MERILSEIRQECGNNMQVDIIKHCGSILDSIEKYIISSQYDEVTPNFKENLQLILQLFKICVETNVTKLNLLSIDLLKIYIRQTNESHSDSIKEYTINQILKQYCNIFNKSGILISSELLAFIIEIAATFGPNLTIVHVIDIIELCHKQIKEYVLRDPGCQSTSNRALTFRNFFTNHKISSEDKVFSALYLTSGQVCHYFVKNKIIGYKNLSMCEENSKTSQDFIHLMLYLIKKLETKVSFFCDVDWHIAEKSEDQLASVNKTKIEILILIKTFNCFYLKCIHFILLTIPDAWKHMTNRLMEVIWKHLAPVLIHILNPTSTISSTVSCSKPGTNDLNNPEKSQAFFGRGSEKLHLSLLTNTKDHRLNSLNYQERQYMYKISMELLRLFGLESSMRPLLEALFYRIFLLPPLNQRLDSLVYMQEIFKNSLLVLILISDPICLFGPSMSNSQYLDLFQIFMDAIKETSLCDNVVLNQLSLACLATLLNTLKHITNMEMANVITNDDEFSETKLKISNSPILKMISNYVERNSKILDVSASHCRNIQRSSRLSKYNTQQNDLFNFSSIKNRIYGYDMVTLESKMYPAQGNELKKVLIENKKNGCQYDDFDYQDKLNALISSESSSTLDSNCFKNKSKKQTKQLYVSYKNNRSHASFKSESFHISFEDVHSEKGWVDFDLNNLRFTNSDSKLNLVGLLSSYDEDSNVSINEYCLESSVFTDSASSDTDDNVNDMSDVDEKFSIPKMFQYPKKENSIDQQSSNLCFFERLLANIFVRKLLKLLPELAKCRNLFSVDESIQSFASNFCKDLYVNLNLLLKNNRNFVQVSKLTDLEEYEIQKLQSYSKLFNNLFINADGIYLTTYMTMLLNLKLLYLNYYEEDSKNIPITEKAFIDDIFNYHITIYVSQNFLAEIYQYVLSHNLFLSIYEEFQSNFNKLPLVKFLLDIDILDRNNPDSFKLSDYVRLEQVANKSNIRSNIFLPNENSNHAKQLNLLVKRFCICFLDPILLCLQQALYKKFTFQNMVQLIDSYNVTYINSICLIFNCENKNLLAQSKNTNISIQIILMLFEICDKICFYNQMDKIYEQLYEYIIKFWNQDSKTSNQIKNFNLKKSFSSNDVNSFDQANSSLSFTQIIALKTLLTNPTRIGSCCPRIWKSVLDLCKFVIDVENFTFRSSRSSLLSRARVSINTILKSNSMSMSFASDFDSNLHADHYQNLYDHNSFNQFPGINEVEYSNFEQRFDMILNEIKNKKIDLGHNSKDLEEIIEYLSLLVSQIFENISLKCNLSLLNNFICELCDYSKMQLMESNDKNESLSFAVSQWSNQECKSLMLFRLVEVILRFVRNGRPLLHFMRMWPVISSHLVLASTHKESNISKKAITSLHDIINAFLSSYSELNFFNFNESLFKPYEKLLRFEMCNSESQQELVLYSICEFVEGASKEIRSGWKSIFKALKGLRLSIDESQSQSKFNCTHHIQILTDTFEAFLRTDNMHVLAYASVDFIPCIFHLIRNFSSKPIDQSISEYQNEVFIVFLKCLQKFSKILRSINELSEDSFINFSVRIKKTRSVDIEKIKESLNKIDSDLNLEFICLNGSTKDSSTLIDHSVSLMEIWYMFLDEYALTICSSHLEFRPMLLEVYFTLFQIIIDTNDTLEFSIFCFNHINLPMIQCLLRETLNNEKQIDELYIFLKNWLYIFDNYSIKLMLSSYSSNNDNIDEPCSKLNLIESSNLLLKQTLLIYIECLNGEYHDFISTLSLSLIKHLLLSLHQVFTSELWKIVIDYFKIAHQLTIHPLVSLVNSLINLPIDLSSDLQQIKIMTIRKQNALPSSYHYVQRRARQVFFIDTMQFQKSTKNYPQSSSSFSQNNQQFRESCLQTIIVETSSGIQKSISYSLFIIQVHNHLNLLQIISSILNFNVKPHFTELVPFFYENIDEICFESKTSNSNTIPLLNLQLTQYNELCFFLKQSFMYSMKFDSRPGLKYLLRHICHSSLAPNLYQISALVWSTQFSVNFFLCSNAKYRNEEHLSILEEIFGEIASIYIEKSDLSRKQKIKKLDKSQSMIQTIDIVESRDHFESDLNEQKFYQMMSSNKVSKLLEEYRKTKCKHGQMFQYDTNKHFSDSSFDPCKHQDSSAEFLESDLDIFIRLWNDIISKCLQLHIECDIDSFCFMLLQYQKLIRTMIMHSFDPKLQEAILSWINKLSNQILLFKMGN